MDYKELANEIIEWIRDWFKSTNAQGPAVVGISGGKDSTIVGKLCLEALGENNVIGVSMPDEGQNDEDAKAVAEAIGLKHLITVPIQMAVRGVGNNAFASCVEGGLLKDKKIENLDSFKDFVSRSEQNLPPRIRMATLYYISQLFNGRVIGTCNASENYVGYFTKWGDGASDLEPLGNLTVEEVKGVGYALGIPTKWVDKIPDDGLPNSAPDNEKFERMGFNYEKLDQYIRKGTSGDPIADKAIEREHQRMLFKLKPVEIFTPSPKKKKNFTLDGGRFPIKFRKISDDA